MTGEVIPMSRPEVWATPDEITDLIATVEALRAEAEATGRLVGVRVEQVGPDYLDMTGGHERMTFSRQSADRPWSMTRRNQAPGPQQNTVDVTTVIRPLIAGAHGGISKRRYEAHANTYYALFAPDPITDRDVLDPLTGDNCQWYSDQLVLLIPERHRNARLTDAAARAEQQAA